MKILTAEERDGLPFEVQLAESGVAYTPTFWPWESKRYTLQGDGTLLPKHTTRRESFAHSEIAQLGRAIRRTVRNLFLQVGT